MKNHFLRVLLTVLVLTVVCGPWTMDYCCAGEVTVSGEGKSAAVSNGKTRIAAIAAGAGVTGFRVSVFEGEKEVEVCVVELTSGDRWFAKTVETGKESGRAWFVLKDIDTSGTGKTPEFGKDSFVKVLLGKDNPFPRVEFSLNLQQSFDRDKWTGSWETKCPFYFLRCTVDDAAMFYHGGFEYPAKKTDPFPISFDAQMRGTWAENWTYAVAMGAHNTPAAGLWAGANGRFIAYDFTHARLTDRSDKFIACAYCAGQPDHPKQFFTLLFPHAGQWTELRFPKGKETLSSHFDIIWKLDCFDWDDPQMFVLNRTYTDFYDLLPAVPAMTDLSWMGMKDANGSRENIIRTRTEAGEPGLIGGPMSGLGDFWATLWATGARPIGQTFLADALEEAYRKKNKAAIARVKTQLEELMSKPTRVKIGGDECVAWNHPIEGSMSKGAGGEAATTIRHESTFHIGAAMLIIYRHEGTEEYLPFIDGVFNWCKHYLWTRNGVPDLPWAMFSRVATAAGESFLLNYYRIFKNDPDRGKNAEQAIELARAATYKNTWYFLADPDEADGLDPTFLMQVVDSKWWMGQLTWAEGGYVLRTMIPVYCETGDPVLKYILRGVLERWWQGYNKDGYSFEENVEIFGEMNPKARRSLGSPDPGHGANCWRYALPGGGAIARVVCGRAAAICFDTGTTKIDITDYYYEPETNFQFKITGDYPGLFSMMVSSPFRDISGQGVCVNGKQLAEDSFTFNKFTDNEDVLISGVKCGDVIRIGEIKQAKKIEIKPIKTRKKLEGKSASAGDFEYVNLYPLCNTALDMRWKGENSWFGLIPGEHWFKGIPFYIADPDLNSGKNAVDASKEISIAWQENAKAIAVIFGVSQKDAALTSDIGVITIVYDKAGQEQVNITRGLNALSNNEFPLQKWRAEMFAFKMNKDAAVTEIRIKCRFPVFAVTAAGEKTQRSSDSLASIEKEQKEALEKTIAEAKYIAQRDALTAKCKDIVAKAQAKKPIKICLIPPRGDIIPVSNLEADPGKLWPIGNVIKKAAEDLGITVDVPKVSEFVDNAVFNPANYPIAFYFGHEEYIRTYKTENDCEDALLNYLKNGGFLIVAGPGGTYPFFYPMDYEGGKWNTQFKKPADFGRQFELFICGSGAKKGESRGFESPPTDEVLTFKINKNQKVFTLLPQTMPYPKEPDPRWRPVSGEGLAPEDEYIPILNLENDSSEPYGQGIALIKHGCPDFKGASVLYFWGSLLDTQYGEGMLLEAIAYAVQAVAK